LLINWQRKVSIAVQSYYCEIIDVQV